MCLLRCHSNGNLRGDSKRQLDDGRMIAGCFDRFSHFDLVTIDVDAEHRFQRIGDLRVSHGAKDSAALAGLGSHHRWIACQPCRQLLRFGEKLFVALSLRGFGVCCLRKVARSRLMCQLARQKIITGVTVGNFDDCTRFADPFEIFAQDDFHMRCGRRFRLTRK